MNDPEKPTLIERFVQLIPVPYPLAALIWALIFGAPVFHLLEYLDHGSTSFSLQPSQLYTDTLFTVVPLYSFLIVRYLRLNILTGENEIARIMSGGEQAYHTAFKRFSRTPPVLLLSIPLGAFAFQATMSNPHLSLQTIGTSVFLVINVLAIATFIWTYSASSWGLHKLGESKLELKSFLEDRLMGARPIGNIALSSTVAYLGGILLIFLLFPGYFLEDIAFQSLLITVLALGIIMFFLPLNSLHKQLVREKTRHQKQLNQQLLSIKKSNQTDPPNGPASMERVENKITELVRLKDLEITERKLASSPTWPFDVQLLVKLITIVLSVTAALLAESLSMSSDSSPNGRTMIRP